MVEIKLYKSPWRAVKLILLCSIFVVTGIFLLETDSPKWIAWMSIGFFGLGYPVGLFHLFDRRPQIVINEIGLLDRTTHNDYINWNIMRGAYLIDIHRQKFVCLLVDEQFEPSKKRGKVAKSLVDLNKSIGAQELNISLGQIVIDEIKFTEFVKKMITAEPTRRIKELKEAELKR
jgi:hypothetical protein